MEPRTSLLASKTWSLRKLEELEELEVHRIEPASLTVKLDTNIVWTWHTSPVTEQLAAIRCYQVRDHFEMMKTAQTNKQFSR